MKLSDEANNLNWMVNNFVEECSGVREAIVVSSDGLGIAASEGLDRNSIDRFSAVASGLIGLSYGAAGRFGGGAVKEVIVEMENIFLFVTGISDGSLLAVIAQTDSDIGQVAYDMAVLVEQTGQVLTPQLRQELQLSIGG